MLGHQRSGIADQLAVPGDACFQFRLVRRIEPGNASAPAEARHAGAAYIAAMLLRPVEAGVEVSHDLLVGNGENDLADLVDAVQSRDIALPYIQVRSDRKLAKLGEAADDILDMLVNAENFLHHQDDRMRTVSFGRRPVGGNVAVAGGYLDLFSLQAGGIRGDQGSLYRRSCRGKRCERGVVHEFPLDC